MKTQLTFCLLLSFCLGTVFTTEAQVDKNDSLALVDLYNSTNGPSWTNHDNWLTGPVKRWYGIYLTAAGKRVREIYLGDNNLTGHIPSSLGGLTNLYLLALNNNQLTGVIPTELVNLTDLAQLYLYSNQLSGPIPEQLGNLPNLIYLYLNNNQLSGSIPSQLGNLSKLYELYLSDNQLSGPIPPELGNLSNLGVLDLTNDQLNGRIPPELGKLSAVSYFSLQKNQLSGPIPPELGNLSNLSGLYLNGNQLSGNIPPELGDLSNLSGLYLNSNKLSGNIPPELGNLSNIYVLDLSNNKLSGNIPPELGNLSNLAQLYLYSNQLSGPVPRQLGNLNFNIFLNLSHNKFTFDGMEFIAQTLTNFTYNWQAPIPLHLNDNTLSVSAGGTLSNNTYMWFNLRDKSNTTIKGDSVFHPSESGIYFVVVINKIAKQLKLASRAVKYFAPSLPDAVASTKQHEILNNTFSVYPNPAKNSLHITANSSASFSLMAEDGKVLVSNIDKTGIINISNIAAGVYYLKNNETNVSKKIAVIK